VQEVLLLDVTPLTLGVETQGGVATAIIPRNTTVPTSMSQVFSTTEDAQTVVRIHVVQGEREMARDNKTLGRFELVGLPPAPRGVPQIEVTFDIDADGVVKVSAKDLGTGRTQAIQVTASSGLGEAEIERLVAEAASHAEADRARRELVDLRNQCDGLIYSTERTLSEFAENVNAGQREALLAAIDSARAAAAIDEVEPLRAAMGELSARTYELTERLYAELGGKKAEE
jgi:molecular chaperone DnaK